ncbi:helix-turn-helix domain-containing protein [Rhizobium sophoriradicis]|uniref:helix-turn-helix domain-containing protein n=1 Tax=Rhizobium sophoriradicis TaxID=1535245 RepID=UPI00117A95DE|nr:helix-turn-helix domain-containing protein [Rhizobium sophoriradicis]
MTGAMLHQLVQQVEEGTKLTPNEHDLVVLFAQRAGRVVTIGHCDLGSRVAHGEDAQIYGSASARSAQRSNIAWPNWSHPH